MDKIMDTYENLYHTLRHKACGKVGPMDNYTLLDRNGQNILYILYCMYMHKHKLPYQKYIVKDVLSLDKTNHNVWLNVDKMPKDLRHLIKSFIDLHTSMVR